MRTDHRGLRAGAPWGVKIELREGEEGTCWVKLQEQTFLYDLYRIISTANQ